MKGIIGIKVGMTQVFDDEGRAVPVTVIHAEPNKVLRLRTQAKDGYDAVQLGVGAIKPHKVAQPQRKDFEKLGVEPVRFVREFRLPGATDLEPGSVIKVEDAFSPGDIVDVTGTSKGKGFAGVIKRWGFRRGPTSHGSKYHRRVGSLAARTSGGGGRVHPGRKMPGHKGHARVTVLRLRVERVDADRNLLLVRGAVPGPRGSLVMVRDSVRNRKGAM
ncbi:50S ribosomal protein L3 [Sulfobacillus thermosulfidooxidans]|uniref:Large ribosomal subunit protein uL3 n=1 Tax=Sulfobacillus thermosulfidooxidans TaxID=28034 RepID=A0A1R0ILA5_SULTH|nr:50S ribosomal protein L3 [Sulfobacillus thermosulfidooxidans]OLZ10953.1 50S ribosomal protein L3 [Sulfobacillus thermosulfidooxidans]OLZ14441.1 50S ribosomal protein L3 [Sulfobacillus thermosulfidooxidans]OLZ19184.1 50S ribosomal protein L3 [Sulfobacillus thermosulfidooxidans]PSR28433.1 MAG: 50S ribosomal protein L3 [Sulfobacillus thermosulfidooxidans]